MYFDIASRTLSGLYMPLSFLSCNEAFQIGQRVLANVLKVNEFNRVEKESPKKWLPLAW